MVWCVFCFCLFWLCFLVLFCIFVKHSFFLCFVFFFFLKFFRKLSRPQKKMNKTTFFL